MNTLIDLIKSLQVAGKQQRVTICWSLSISRFIVCGILVALLLTACSSLSPASQPPRTEEITFQSGSFRLVGDLRLPGGSGPYPVVVFVHGSGLGERTVFGMFLPIMERMLRAGYATFSWDKPGEGESTGQLDDNHMIHQRAQIVLDAIEALKARPDIDPRQIGLWGVSQAGYVMPLALSMSEDIAFMICISCAGMAGVDQGAYLGASQAVCGGVPEEKADQLSSLLPKLDKVRTYETYDEYLAYREVLVALADIGPDSSSSHSRSVIPEDAWQENNPDYEGWWNPIEVIEQARIPVLAIWGEKDTQVDPIQGAHAYRKALERASNPNYRVEVLPGADHMPGVSQTGCVSETEQTFERVLQAQGYWPLSEAAKRIEREPGPHTPLSAWPYAPGYLDMLEEWLRDLRR